MDVNELLDHVASFPPPPFSDGCARLALRQFLWILKIFGAYHEHDYYSHLASAQVKATEPRRTSNHYLHVVNNHNNEKFVVCTTPQEIHTPYTTDQISQGPLFVRRQLSPSNNHTPSVKDNTIDFRRRETLFSNMAAKARDSMCPPNNDIATININETKFQPATGYISTEYDDFLIRCDIVDTHLTRSMIDSLGYDVPRRVCQNTASEKTGSKPSSTWFRGRKLWSDRTYACIFLLIHWANVFRCIMYTVHDYPVTLMTSLIPFDWFLMVAACNTWMFVCCARRDQLRLFFHKWATLYQDPVTRRLGLRGVLNRRFVIVIVIVQWAVTFTNVVCIAFIMIMDDSFSAGMNRLFLLTGHRSTTVVVLSAIGTFFTTATWIGTTNFVIVACHHVESHFRQFSQVLRLHIAAAGQGFPRTLNLFRERHLAMCDTVSILDRYMRLTIGISFSVFIANSCMLIFLAFRVPMDKSVMAVTVFWLVSCLLLTGIPAHFMANVNVAMHAVSDDLLTLQTRHMTLEQFGQLQLFLAKVNGPNMGFTILGLLVITRELLLTLFGIYLTYGIVLLQFP